MFNWTIYIIILIFFVFILVILFIYFLKIIKNLIKEWKIYSVFQKIKLEKILKINAIISKSEKMAKKNTNYQNFFLNLKKEFILWDNLKQEIETEIQYLKNHQNNIKLIKWNQKLKEIKIKILKFDNYDKKINFISTQFFDKDELILKNFLFFSKNLRLTINIYKKQKNKFNNFSKLIEVFILKIQKQEQKFKNFQKTLNLNHMIVSFQKYKYLVKLFINFISKISKIQILIQKNIPLVLENFKKNIFTSEIHDSKIDLSFYYLQHQKFINKINLKLKNLKNKLNFLEIILVEKEIKKILKEMQTYKKEMQNQIWIQKFLIFNIKKFNIIFDFISKNAKNKLLKLKSNMQNFNLLFLIDNLKKEQIKFNLFIQEKQFNNKKINNFKICIQNINILIKKIFFVFSEIEKMYQNSLNVKNKIEKIQIIIKQINTNIKKNNIKINKKEEKNIFILLNNKNEIMVLLNKKNINIIFLKQQTEYLLIKTLTLYKIINLKIKQKFLILFLLQKLNSQKIINKKINQILKNTQKHFLAGKYNKTLSIIIKFMEHSKLCIT